MKQSKRDHTMDLFNERNGRPNLMDPNILSSRQAVEEWELNDSTLRRRASDFPMGTIRKFGNSWAVTREGMNFVFGPPAAYKGTENKKGNDLL